MSVLKPTDKQPNLRASILSSTEPYHIPGYAGHKRQYVFRCGETFGVATNRLLTSDIQRRNDGGGILKNIDPPRSQSVDLGFHEVPKLSSDDYDIKGLLTSRRHKWGDQLYKPNMRSGYAGFVPKAHFSSYHSKTFPNICNDALRDFVHDQRDYRGKQRTLRDVMELQCAPTLLSPQREAIGTSQSLPLRPVSREIPNFVSKSAVEKHDSPYFLPNEHPQKYFKSGYAGHVPFAKDLSGHSFPTITNQSLQKFTNDANRYKTNKNKPLQRDDIIRDKTKQKPPLQRPHVYLIDKGIIPRYSGYVPGQKFRFGKTFTSHTVNVLKVGPDATPQIRSVS